MEHRNAFWTYLENFVGGCEDFCGVVGVKSCFRDFHCARLPKLSILGEPSHNR